MSDRTPPPAKTDGKFVIAPWGILFADISDGAYRLYSVLSTYADQEGACWPSRATLALDLRKSRDTVDRLLKELVDIGAVVIHKRRRADGSLTSSEYTVRRHVADAARPSTLAHEEVDGVAANLRLGTLMDAASRTRTIELDPTQVPRSTTSIQVSRAATPRRTAAEPKPTTQQRIARAAANDPISPTWYHSTERQDLISRVQAIAAAKTAGSDTWDAEEAFWDALDAALDADISGMQDQGWAPPRKATSKHGAAAWLNMLLAAWQADNGSLDYM